MCVCVRGGCGEGGGGGGGAGKGALPKAETKLKVWYCHTCKQKIRVINMACTFPDGPHVGPINLAIRVILPLNV